MTEPPKERETPVRGLGAKAPPLVWRDPRQWPRNFTALLKNITPRGLLPRALLIIVVPVLLLELLMAYIFFDRHWDRVAARLTRAVAGDVGAIAEIIENEPDAARRDAALARAKNLFDMQIISVDNTPLPERAAVNAITENFLYGIFVREMAGALPEREFYINLDTVPAFADVRVTLSDGRVLTLHVPMRRITSSTAYIYMLWMAGLSIVLLTIAILFLRNQVRPIMRLAEAADRFGRGLEMPGFRPSGATEVRTAARAFIAMRNRLDRQLANRTAMLAGVSHDLRTPLTRLRLELALLDDAPSIKAMQDDLAEMENMLNAYLDFAKGLESDPPEVLDMGAFLRGVIMPLQRGGRAVSLFIQGNARVHGRPMGLTRAITNLVENGCRYGTNVTVTMQPAGRSVNIIIDDDGPGIPPEKREEMFRPFTRMEESRNKATGGVGLGLTVARDMANIHGGELTLGQSPDGGLRAVFRLPVEILVEDDPA